MTDYETSFNLLIKTLIHKNSDIHLSEHSTHVCQF
jgi:hypothetical protein